MGSNKLGLASISEGRSDLFHIDPRVIRVEEGWNCRDINSKETQDHIEALALSIAAMGVREPLTVFYKDGVATVTDGHCRLLGARLAISRGCEIRTVPVKSETRYCDDADRIFSQIVRNSGKPFSPLENANVYKRLLDLGWSQADIAKRAGISQGRVSQVLELLTLPAPIKRLVSSGQVSATLATSVVADHNDADAIQVLVDAVSNAKSEGKTKATAKDIPAGAPKVNIKTLVRAAFEASDIDQDGDQVIVTFSVEQFELIRQALKL